MLNPSIIKDKNPLDNDEKKEEINQEKDNNDEIRNNENNENGDSENDDYNDLRNDENCEYDEKKYSRRKKIGTET